MLICPFTKKKLRLLDDRELNQLNAGIEQGLFYFFDGVPVDFKLEKAYSANNQVYIYPVVENVVFLKKRTAIVQKNRTRNPHKRVIREVADAFYDEFGFKSSNSSAHLVVNETLPLQELDKLQSILPKSGKVFMSLAINDVDAIHHLMFEKKFDSLLHLDHSFHRLKALTGQLIEGTHYVLTDEGDLPIADKQIDAVLGHDFPDDDIRLQKLMYAELKRCLSPDSTVVFINDNDAASGIRDHYKSDKVTRNLLKLITPWKKQRLPSFHFYSINRNSSKEATSIKETSLRRQLSS